LSACAIAVPGAAAVAQQYSDTTSVVVVEVPVQVTRDGEPVSGLTAENFEILDEGKEQVISGFEIIDLRAEDSSQQMRTMSVAARRHFVFVFDLSFSDPNAVAKARGAAFDLVRTSLHPTDLIAVATYSNRTGPRLVLNFTTDRRQVERAFSTLGLLSQERPIDDPLGVVVDQTEIAGGSEAAAEPSEGRGGAGGLAPDAEIQAAIERMETAVTQSNLRQQVDIFGNTFGFLADMLAPLDGRKHVVFLSEGFDASVLFGTTDQERITEMQQAVESGEFWEVDNEERLGSTDALGQLREVLDSFKRADATIHSIDISGVRSDTTEARLARGRQDGLFLLASQTDGEFYRNYNDLSQAMGEMLERTSVTYLLAFQPTDPRRKAESFHRLRVKLEGVPGGADLSYRQGYFPPTAFAALDETQSNLRAAQQMHGAAPEGGLTAKVLATPLAGPTRAYVPVMLYIPGTEITSTPLGDELALELYAYAMDAEGVVRDYFAESLKLDVEQVGAALQSAGVKFYGHLDLDPGDYALRVMVRDGRDGRTSVDVIPLVVPDFSQVALNVLPPLFPEGTEHFVAVRETPDPAQPDAVEYPFVFKGQSFIPAIHPVFEVAQVVAVSLVATCSSRDWLEVGALVLAADGTPVPGTFLRVLERERDADSGMERMIGAFEVPNLPDGEYELVVTMSNGSTGDVESGSLPFSVGRRGNAVLFEPPRWMPDLADIVTQLGPQEGEASIVKIDRGAVETGYKRALRMLADGRETGAVLELAQLESSSLNPDNPMNSLAQVAKVQMGVVDQLARRDPELLLPAILLHKEAYSQYRLRKRPYLSVHARRMTLELIDLYAEKARGSQAPQLASRILTGMAAEVYGSGAHISAQGMFARALELDATNGVALLGLGFMYESSGRGDHKTPRYEDAIHVLARAVEVEPDLHEARLRLGINLGRVGRMREGAAHLHSLIDRGDTPPWIASLAYQELARLYLNSESYDQARRVLERGVEKIPEDSKLALQLAYVYERCQDQRQANRASAKATGQSLSARYLYLQVPQAVEESSVAWLAAATKNLPALAAALPPATTGVES
jgi:VWFA-related protein